MNLIESKIPISRRLLSRQLESPYKMTCPIDLYKPNIGTLCSCPLLSFSKISSPKNHHPVIIQVI